MPKIELRGLAWGHRRATGPLAPATASFRRHHPDIDVAWEVRPLSDFEHQGIAGLARRYDLIICDHPSAAILSSAQAYVPLDEHVPDLLGPAADALYAGPSLASYRYAGHVWAAPIDAATQHAALRRDLLDMAGERIPRAWPDVIALGTRLRRRGLYLGIAVSAPHALLVLSALMANAGVPWSTDPARVFTIDRDGLRAAMGLFRPLLELCPRDALSWNSIDLHDAMVARDDIAYAPCVYGYATYGEADMRRRLAFADFPGVREPYAAGTAIGGTGLALSRHCAHPQAALEFIRHMLGAATQDRDIPAHHGQPALRSAWAREDNNVRFNGFYRDVDQSMNSGWVRPRLPGYIAFQQEAGAIIATWCRDEIGTAQAIDAVLATAERVNL